MTAREHENWTKILIERADPPKHPRGVSRSEALKGLDWIGGLLFTVGAILVLVGIVYTSYVPSTDARVLACLVVGFVVIIAFGFWERLSSVKYPLCPTDIFTSHNGREFTEIGRAHV